MKVETYVSYIRKVWKSRNHKGKISKQAMDVLNGFMEDTFAKITRQSSEVLQRTGTVTLMDQTIITALRLLLPRELELHTNNFVQIVKAGREPIFPAGRLHRYLKQLSIAPRVSRKAAVAMAAALEYLVGEILDVAANAATSMNSRTLKPRHIALAVRSDEDLDAIFGSTTIASGGVLPRVHNALLAKNKKKKPKAEKKKSR